MKKGLTCNEKSKIESDAIFAVWTVVFAERQLTQNGSCIIKYHSYMGEGVEVACQNDLNDASPCCWLP